MVRNRRSLRVGYDNHSTASTGEPTYCLACFIDDCRSPKIALEQHVAVTENTRQSEQDSRQRLASAWNRKYCKQRQREDRDLQQRRKHEPDWQQGDLHYNPCGHVLQSAHSLAEMRQN